MFRRRCDFSVRKAFAVEGREWLVARQTGITGTTQFLIVLRCACGSEAAEDLPHLGGFPSAVSCEACGAKTLIPEQVAETAKDFVHERRTKDWEIRAASGGPRGFIPI